MKEKFKNLKGNFTSGNLKNFSVYGNKCNLGNEKEEALRIAKEMHKNRIKNINNFLDNKKQIEKETKFKEFSDEEIKKQIEYSKTKNKEFIESGLNEQSDLTETIQSIVNDLFN